jgi:hypothetical protein
MKPHKHAEAIKEFVDGKECEYFDSLTKHWEKIEDLGDFVFDIVRIKPEPIEDVIDYMLVDNNSSYLQSIPKVNWVYKDNANLKLTWDGETGKLKLAEVIL